MPAAYDAVEDAVENPEYRSAILVWQLFEKKIREVHSVGFGCCMIKREVLEKIALRAYEGGNTSGDIFFCIDAKKQGFSTFLDTRVWAQHHCWTLGDERNKHLSRWWNKEQQSKIVK